MKNQVTPEKWQLFCVAVGITAWIPVASIYLFWIFPVGFLLSVMLARGLRKSILATVSFRTRCLILLPPLLGVLILAVPQFRAEDFGSTIVAFSNINFGAIAVVLLYRSGRSAA